MRLSRYAIWCLLLVSLLLRLLPAALTGNDLVFDEAYYVPAARDLLALQPSNLEHPFLGKAWASLGILLFGDYWWGWRSLYIGMGTLALYAFYRLALHFLKPNLALYATLLLALENLFFIHGSLALLDIPSIAFAQLGLHAYFSGRSYRAALLLGLAFLNKEVALLHILALASYQMVRAKGSMKVLFYRALAFLAILSATILLPLTAYDALYRPSWSEVSIEVIVIEYRDPLGNLLGRSTTYQTIARSWSITNGLEHLYYMTIYMTSLTLEGLEAGLENYPWNWLLPLPGAYEPSVYYAKYGGEYQLVGPSIAWLGIGNMPLWWSFWSLLPFLGYRLLRYRSSGLEAFLLLWMSSTYLPFLYLSLSIGRITYPFYFLNTVPAIALGIPYMLASLLRGRWLVLVLFAYLGVVGLFFAYYYPLSPWLHEGRMK